ncbi:MAG: glycosyltransferase family 1 protein [Candidatus Falkowbacteria bacterium]
MLKIGIDIRTLMDEHYSGVSEYTFHLVNEFLRLDKDDEFGLYYNSGRDISSRLPSFSEKNVKVVGTRYPNKIFNYVLQKLLGYPKIDKTLGGVDVFWSPHINFLSLSKAPRKFLTIHDLSFLRYPEFFNKRKNLWHQLINTKNLANNFDHLIAVSQNTKNDIVELLHISPEKVTVIHSGIDSPYHLVSDFEKFEKVKIKYELPEKFILYLGNVEPRKNLIGLIKAYNELRSNHLELFEFKLVIAGATGWKIKDIFNELYSSEYENDIKFLGYVDKEDKPSLYSLCSVFVYPSFYEGFGFPPLEAMACGAPVVTSNVSSLPEIVGSAALTVDPYNVGAISEAMVQVLTDDALAEKLRQEGFRQVKKFSWENTARQYLELFRKDN